MDAHLREATLVPMTGAMSCGLTAGALNVFGGFGLEQKHTWPSVSTSVFILGTLTHLAVHICCCFSVALSGFSYIYKMSHTGAEFGLHLPS